MVNEIRHLSAPNLILAGKTVDVRARTADPAPLNDKRCLPGLRQMLGQVFSALAASDDDVLVGLRRHAYLCGPTSQSRLARTTLSIRALTPSRIAGSPVNEGAYP